MEVVYLNLARREDRNERFLRSNSHCVDLQRMDAVDGARLRMEDLIREGIAQEPLTAYTPGALGNAVSHKLMWERCISSGMVLTVAEDDAIFNVHFAERAEALLQALPRDWDIVLWGWNFDSVLKVEVIEGLHQAVMQLTPPRLGRRVAEFQEKDFNVQPLRLVEAFGVVCYSVSPKGARRLRELCFPLRNELIAISGLNRRIPNYTIDVLMNKYYRSLQAYVCFPPLVWTENDKASSDVCRHQAV